MEALKLSKRTNLILNSFVGELASVFGDLLVSLTLYGSASSGEFTDNASNLNILVILKNDCPEDLSSATPVINKWKYRKIAPLFMSEEYIKKSCDVFPIEFLDIKENHLVLFGEDIFRTIKVDTRNLRFQCEHELKAKIMNLKQFYARNSGNKTALGPALFRAITPVIHILRSALHIKGNPAPYNKGEAVNAIGREYGIDTVLWLDILAAKAGLKRIRTKDAASYFAHFIDDTEKVAEVIDRM